MEQCPGIFEFFKKNILEKTPEITSSRFVARKPFAGLNFTSGIGSIYGKLVRDCQTRNYAQRFLCFHLQLDHRVTASFVPITKTTALDPPRDW